MIQTIKRWLYDLITASGIIYRLLPLIKPFIWRFAIKADACNFKLTDSGGATMKVTKYHGKIFPPFGVDRIASIRNAKIRRDDVIICGYPKTGCHWTYEILHALLCGKADLSKYGKILGGMVDSLPDILLDSLPSPRVLNSHVRYDELPLQVKEKKIKIIWTVRSPKDAVVSHYHHTQALSLYYEYQGTFDNFFELFMSGQIEYGSFFDYVLAWEEVLKTQNDNSIFVVEYEKLKADTVGMVKEMARFLDLAITDKFARDVADATQFDRMKEGQPDNKLLRKGQVGDWRNWLTDEQSARIDQVWQDRMSDCLIQPTLD